MTQDKQSLTSSPLPLDQVIQGDCFEVLASLPQESVDLIFADPPYNLQLAQELWRPNLTLVDAVNDDWDQFSSFTEYDRFTQAWLAACRRVLKPTGAIWVIGTYHNIYRVGTILQNLGYWILNDIVWIKTNPMPNFRGVRFTNAHETLLWAQKERKSHYTFNHHAMKSLNGDLQMRSDWIIPICVGKERLRINGQKAHPTQKPEALLYRVILSSTKPGDIVLDPFFGTGTTGAVAKRLHRHWIGIERNPDYVQLSRQRIAAIPENHAKTVVFVLPNPRRLKRIPFGRLVEDRLLEPGQRLFFDNKDNINATILSDGSVEYNGLRGSIHQVARAIREGPCNGWEIWYYQDSQSGLRHPVDFLRQQVRHGIDPEDKG